MSNRILFVFFVNLFFFFGIYIYILSVWMPRKRGKTGKSKETGILSLGFLIGEVWHLVQKGNWVE